MSTDTKSNAEIWNYGTNVENVLTQYDDLRYRLLHCIYSAAWGVTNRGETLMRALPLEFWSDPRARANSDQFLFGPALLINPVTTGGGHSDPYICPRELSGWISGLGRGRAVARPLPPTLRSTAFRSMPGPEVCDPQVPLSTASADLAQHNGVKLSRRRKMLKHGPQ